MEKAAPDVDDVDEGLGDLNLELLKKKKKKSAAAKDILGASSQATTTGDSADSRAAEAATAEDPSDNGDGNDNINDDDDVLPLDLTPAKKKNRKKLTKERIAAMAMEDKDDAGDNEEDDDNDDGDDDDDDKAEMLRRYPWLESDRDYHYEELLDRVFGILRANNPELSGEKRRTILKPPQVVRQGTKTTIFTNFGELCGVMHRPFEHTMSYILAELGTSGSVDGQDRLNVKGRFTPKTFEGILRRYINEYVICNMCKSTDTVLTREHRLHVLRCNACGASRSVGTIKSGFVAQVGRRKKA